MRILILAVLAIGLVGCAAAQPYRDATNRGRTIADMQIDGAICQTVLPSPPAQKPPTLCPTCDAIDSLSIQIKRQRLFDGCMSMHGWAAAR
jgi:hypothetical protein